MAASTRGDPRCARRARRAASGVGNGRTLQPPWRERIRISPRGAPREPIVTLVSSQDRLPSGGGRGGNGHERALDGRTLDSGAAVSRRSAQIFLSVAQLQLLATLPASARDAPRPAPAAGSANERDAAASAEVPFTAAEDLAARRRELARRSGLPPPKPVLPPPERTRFIADPLSDGALLSLGLGVGALSEAILFTGELTPQAPGDPSKLLSIDRGAVDQASDSGWVTVGSVGLLSAFGFAAVDPVLSGFRSGSEAGIVDAFMYGETLSITWATTNILKIAFRRPRPSAYREARALREGGVPQGEIADRITDTNSALSFVSGHASVTAGVAATASYLAFSRAPGTPRPWITMGAGGVVTALTSLARVRSGDHFPTDVIAGSMVGFGIGILVPHAHRAESATRRPVWIGAAPADDGGFVTVSGLF